MNIFQKIKLANKILKIYSDVKRYNEENRITSETKEDIEIIRNSIKRLANRIPVYNDLFKIVEEVLCPAKKK